MPQHAGGATEDGDLLRVPEQSNLVLVSGEVLFPNALVYEPRVVLLDEPLAGMGQAEAKAMIGLIRALKDPTILRFSYPIAIAGARISTPAARARSIMVAKGGDRLLRADADAVHEDVVVAGPFGIAEHHFEAVPGEDALGIDCHAAAWQDDDVLTPALSLRAR